MKNDVDTDLLQVYTLVGRYVLTVRSGQERPEVLDIGQCNY